MDIEDKTTALRHARRLAAQRAAPDAELLGTLKLCRATGASLREIAEAAGLSHLTVQRLLDRGSPPVTGTPSSESPHEGT